MNNLTIIFDLDGTLVDTAPDLLNALNHVLQNRGFPTVDRGAIGSAFGHGARKIVEHGLAPSQVTPPPKLLDDMVEEFLDYYGANVAIDSKPFPDVVTTLKDFSEQGATLAVCTNKREYLARALLQDLSLNQFFKAIIGGDTIDVRKPDPKHLMHTVTMAGGVLSQSIMVGDSLADVTAAKAANIPVIAVDFGYAVEPVSNFGPDAIISSYSALSDTIQQLKLGM